MVILYTAGYEGLTPVSFLKMLQARGIETLVDVRKFPVSRKPGFSRVPLAENLKQTGIDYKHLIALGNPLKGADHPQGHDYKAAYTEHLKTLAARGAIDQLKTLAGRRKTAILCFEKDHECCHRDLIAQHMAATFGFSIIHLEGLESKAQGRLAL